MKAKATDRAIRPLQVGLAIAGAVARLALPLAMLSLAREAATTALVASVVASLASGSRAWMAQRATYRAFAAAWEGLAAAACARPVESLPRRREDEESVAALIEGAHDHVTDVASSVPAIGSLLASGLGAIVAAVVVFGAAALAWGVALLLLVGGLSTLLGRGLREAEHATWSAWSLLARDVRVLLEGAVELRATGREAGAARDIVALAREVGAQQARAASASARVAMLPASLALVGVALPYWGGFRAVAALVAGERLFEASILGASALSTAFALVQIVQQRRASAPRRERFRRFVASTVSDPATPRARLGGSLAEVPIVFEGFGRDWSGDGVFTPAALQLALPPAAGVAFIGPNGAGKTTAVLALLGVVAPTRGRVTIDGRDAGQLDWSAIGARVAYVPQDPLLVPGESVGWHCRLHEDTPSDDAAVDAALTRVGLTTALESRARARGVQIRDLPAGELSGGERRRLALARALLRPREIYVLDEPEAALDGPARVALMATLADLASQARVILVAHDLDVVPDGFLRVRFDRIERA